MLSAFGFVRGGKDLRFLVGSLDHGLASICRLSDGAVLLGRAASHTVDRAVYLHKEEEALVQETIHYLALKL